MSKLALYSLLQMFFTDYARTELEVQVLSDKLLMITQHGTCGHDTEHQSQGIMNMTLLVMDSGTTAMLFMIH
ncbi:hypothetical protein BDR05DRAFT_967992 [Suillus weaverae]|nr:hypothetical protein BDR05DRAFT_967992 [Suillus weaverae]